MGPCQRIERTAGRRSDSGFTEARAGGAGRAVRAGFHDGQCIAASTLRAHNSAMASALTPFHIAVQVRDIPEARRFYREVLGCAEGRSAVSWVDFDLFGHQFVCHLNPALGTAGKIATLYNPVDAHSVPIPHYGVVLEMRTWHALAARLRSYAVEFVVEPYIRFQGEVGEQATMFLLDPSGNALEFKAFEDMGQLFAS